MVKRKLGTIFSSGIDIVYYLFIRSGANNFPETLGYFYDIAKEFKGKIKFAYLDFDNKESGGVHFDFLGITDDDILSPTVRIFNRETREKFKPAQFETLTADVARKFARDFIDGNIKVGLFSVAFCN